MSFEHAVIVAVRSDKQTHFDSVLKDMHQWHHANSGFVEQEFAQHIVDIFEFTIRRDHRELLNRSVCLLAQWIVDHASEEAANKLFDVVNNPWLVRCLLENVDDPRMLHKCNVEDILYNQVGVVRRKIETQELMLFVKSPASECIKYIFSDPFVVTALNQEEQPDKYKRLSDNDHIFWALTDPEVQGVLSYVLNSLLAQEQTRWIGYYMAAVCARGSVVGYDTLMNHEKFSSDHTKHVVNFFSKPVKFSSKPHDFLSHLHPHDLFLKAATSHLTYVFLNFITISSNDEFKNKITEILDTLSSADRIAVLCGSITQHHGIDKQSWVASTSRLFIDLAPILSASDIDGLFQKLPDIVLNEVRDHPLMQQRILLHNVVGMGESNSKRKM